MNSGSTENRAVAAMSEKRAICTTFVVSYKFAVFWAQAGVIGPVPHAYHRNDNFTTTIGFAERSLATVTYTSLGASQLAQGAVRDICDGAVGVLDDFKSTVVIDARGTTEISVEADKGHRAELEAFARCILDGGDWPYPCGSKSRPQRSHLR